MLDCLIDSADLKNAIQNFMATVSALDLYHILCRVNTIVFADWNHILCHDIKYNLNKVRKLGKAAELSYVFYIL